VNCSLLQSEYIDKTPKYSTAVLPQDLAYSPFITFLPEISKLITDLHGTAQFNRNEKKLL
jgi:hypothetical protein